MKRAAAKGSSDLPRGEELRVVVASAHFYPQIAEWLEDGVRRALDACGVRPNERVFVHVPGCFELPLTLQRLIASERADAAVGLGAVVRGATPHFDYVAGECARGLMAVQLSTGVPIGFGILTTDTMAQAEERADPRRGDKGFEATIAAITVANVGERTRQGPIGFRR